VSRTFVPVGPQAPEAAKLNLIVASWAAPSPIAASMTCPGRCAAFEQARDDAEREQRAAAAVVPD
jgi:hypothetical protein